MVFWFPLWGQSCKCEALKGSTLEEKKVLLMHQSFLDTVPRLDDKDGELVKTNVASPYT